MKHYEPNWEISPFAAKMVGPWGKRRNWLDANLDLERWAFEDLADENRPVPQLEWLIEGLVPLRYLMILGGDSKCGKSWFVTSLALHVANGLPFMGLETKKRGVVWVSFEENRVERGLAFDAWFKSGGPRPERFHFVTSYERLFIDEPLGLQQIAEAASGMKAGLIVIDPLHAAYSAGSISDGATARRVLAGVKMLTHQLDCTVLIIHHLTKQSGLGLSRERMSDSAQILAAASMDWLMETAEPKSPTVSPQSSIVNQQSSIEGSSIANRQSSIPESSIVNQQSSIDSPIDPPQSSIVNQQSSIQAPRRLRLLGRGRGEAVNRTWLIESPAPLQYRLVGHGDKPLNTPVEERILDALALGPATAKRLCKRLGGSASGVRNAITKLVRRHQICVVRSDGRERTFGLPSPLPAVPEEDSDSAPEDPQSATEPEELCSKEEDDGCSNLCGPFPAETTG